MSKVNVLVASLVVLLTAVAGASVVAADTNYDVTLNATDAGNASSLDVYVNNTTQGHDLISNGSFESRYSNGTNITVDYVDSSNNTTASHTFTVGENNSTVNISDATVEYTETVSDDGGGGTTSDDSSFIDGIVNYFETVGQEAVLAVTVSLVVAFVFRVVT